MEIQTASLGTGSVSFDTSTTTSQLKSLESEKTKLEAQLNQLETGNSSNKTEQNQIQGIQQQIQQIDQQIQKLQAQSTNQSRTPARTNALNVAADASSSANVRSAQSSFGDLLTISAESIKKTENN